MVVSLSVPPLDLAAIASLLRERTGLQPPTDIVEQVLRQTGGRPQLINHVEVHAPRSGLSAASWAVGKLNVDGLRILEADIHGLPEVTRTVLQAAALCAVGDYIEPDVIAHITDLSADFVERVLDRERRRGSILTPRISSYRFQHDNWIDALISSCGPAQRRALHARCLALLRADPASDPQQLARHAIGVGPALVGANDLVTLAKKATDVAFRHYAFGDAAKLYEAAARYATGAERIDLLIMQSDALRFRGRWDEAPLLLKQAASLARALGLPRSEAIALVRLEQLTWSYDLDETELTQQLRDVIDHSSPQARRYSAYRHRAHLRFDSASLRGSTRTGERTSPGQPSSSYPPLPIPWFAQTLFSVSAAACKTVYRPANSLISTHRYSSSG